MSFWAHIVALGWAFFLHLAAPFHRKARLAVALRRGWRKQLVDAVGEGGEWAWLHCASMGEFQDARVAALQLKSQLPGLKLFATFQSPTGFAQYANHPDLDAVLLLPFDTPTNARHFLTRLQPRFILFSRSEIWFHYLRQAARLHIPTFLAGFRITNSNRYFKLPFRSYYKRCFQHYAHVFCDEAASAELLRAHGFSQRVSVSGNPRFDRIAELQEGGPILEEMVLKGPVVVAGSVGAGEMEPLVAAIRTVSEVEHWIVVPHEVEKEDLKAWEKVLGNGAKRWTAYDKADPFPRILLVDTVGDLPRFYAAADLAVVGGGFSKKGIHNVLEPVAQGVPVATGPNHRNYVEALELMESGGMAVFRDGEELKGWIRRNLGNGGMKEELKGYFRECVGASERISAAILRHLGDQDAG